MVLSQQLATIQTNKTKTIIKLIKQKRLGALDLTSIRSGATGPVSPVLVLPIFSMEILLHYNKFYLQLNRELGRQSRIQ